MRSFRDLVELEAILRGAWDVHVLRGWDDLTIENLDLGEGQHSLFQGMDPAGTADKVVAIF